MFFRVVSISVMLMLTLTLSAHASYLVTFTLDPGAGISGAAGEKIGWGLTITNDEPINWIWINSASTFTPLSGPLLGDYLDFSLNSDPVAPSQSLYLPFDPSKSTGAGIFSIFGDAPYNQTSSGYIHFTYDVYNGDPFGAGNQVDSGFFDVNAAVSTPEPSTYALLCLSLGVVGYVRRRVTRNEVWVITAQSQVVEQAPPPERTVSGGGACFRLF